MITNANIFEWFSDALSLSGGVIRADQNGPRPTTPYATFKIIQSMKSDFSLKTKTDKLIDDDIIETYTNRHKVIVDINIYSDDGVDLLGKLDQSRYRLATRAILQAVDCALVGSGDIRDLTSLGDTEFKPRYQTEFTFLSWNTITETNQKILVVELDGTFRND